MAEREDRRLTEQEEYLLNRTLYLRKRRAPSARWDHDRCEFWELLYKGGLHPLPLYIG